MSEKQAEVEVKMSGLFTYKVNDNNTSINEEDVVLYLIKALQAVQDKDKDYKVDVIDVDINPNHVEQAPPITPFKLICDHLEDLYNRKNHDYGNSFDKQLDEDGLLVAKIRMSDKISRFSRLINNNALVKDEKITDTIVDLACYSIMTLMWMQKNAIN